MQEPSFMVRFGAPLVANGYKVIPIMPGTKKPGRYLRGQWGDYPAWTRHAGRATTDDEITVWSGWPDAGVGIVGGAVAAVDIDIPDDAALALRIERLARERLGDTPAIRIGRAPKRLLVYRTVEPFRGIKRSPLEVLCLGQQFVAYAIHPETAQPYDWPCDSLADLDIATLPAISDAEARAFLDEAVALLPPDRRPASLAGPDAQEHAGQPAASQKGTREAIRAALAYIPNADLDYDSWVRIGMALKGAIGDTGEDLFAAWSAQSAKNEPVFTAKTWAGFKPRLIGAGTIYHLAMERGWAPDASLVLDGTAPRDETHPAARLLAKMRAEPLAPATIAVPPIPDLARLDGALKLLVDYIIATAIRPQPWLAIGAALAALGALMGRKVRTETNLRSNLYVVGIAESGGGKDHARKAIKESFVAAGLSHHLAGERIASGAGLLSALTREPASLFQIDEFGKFMSNVIDKRRAPKHLSEIWDLLTELATSAGGTLLGAEYADQKERPRQDIIEPCACVHGTTAPQPFWDALKSLSLQDGSLARILVFRSPDDIPDRNRTPAAFEVATDLIASLRRVAAGVVAPTGNLQATKAPGVKPDAYTVPMDPAAQAAFDALDEDLTRRQRAAVGRPDSAVLARVWENTAKVALIKAVSANPDAPVVRGEDADWAREVVAYCVAGLIGDAEQHIADNETERNHKRVLDLVRKSGDRGLARSELIRRTQFLDKRQRDEVIGSLLEAGLIETLSRLTATRPAIVYRAPGGAP